MGVVRTFARLVLAGAIWTLSAAAAANDRVLILSSFGAGDYLLSPTVDGITEVLSARSELTLSIEHLDIEHDPEGRHLAELSNFLTAKYAANRVHAIVALGEPALEFALQLRSRIGGTESPVLFAEAPLIHPSNVAAMNGVSGVLGGYDLVTTLHLIRTLHPDRRRVLLVDDRTTRATWLREIVELAMDAMRHDLDFRETAGLSMAELEAQVAALGPEDVVFYISFTTDALGTRFGFGEALGRISRASAAPVYAALESAAGHGAVGGYMLDPTALGRILGEQLNHILAGASIQTVRPVAEAPHRYVFDFRQLDRWGIDTAALPDGSTITDEPDTFYYRYRPYLVTALGVLAALLVYIGLLLSGIARRERARQGLERLIRQGATPLSIDRPSDALAELADRFRHILPHLAQVTFLRATPAGFEPLDGPAPPADLLAEAAAGANTFRGPHALLHLRTQRLSADLVHCRAQRRLDPVDQRILDLFARNVAIECENLNAARLASSLETAHDIQNSMLPKSFAEVSRDYGIDLSAMVRPAREVGGDLYDFFALDEDRLCVLVGDVSDKGVPAALFMSMTRTLIRSVAEATPDPKTILERTNARLAAENSFLMFVTLFLAILDRRTGAVDYVNCGHNAPLVRPPAGPPRWLEVDANIALGIMEGASFTLQHTTLEPGSTLVLYTDGVTEAENPATSQFGEDRLLATVDRGAPDAAGLVGQVLGHVDSFAAGAAQSDDITLLALTWPAGTAPARPAAAAQPDLVGTG